MKLPAFLSFLSLRNFFVFGMVVLLSISLGRTIVLFKDRKAELARLQEEVNVLSAKVGEKQAELKYRQSPDFIYKVALEQLNWARPGEIIVFLPDIEEKIKLEKSSSKKENAPAPSLTAEPDPHWKQWRTLFFGN